jgi:hypothetical protein
MYIPFSFTTTQGKISATGGTEVTFTSGGIEYKSHTFQALQTSSFSVISGITSEAKILIVGAGGGSGGQDFADPDYYPAGGGGGQVIASSSVSLKGGETYEIVVSAAGTQSTSTAAGGNGGLSYIVGPAISSSAYGGGGGGAVDGNGLDGGCGGGAGVNKTTATSPGTAIHGAFGNNGGQETACPEPAPAANRGGAGGGAGGAGSNNNPGAGFETTIRNGTTEYVAHGGAPGIPGTICSYSSLPTGWSTALAGRGGSLGGPFAQVGIVIITYPNPQ